MERRRYAGWLHRTRRCCLRPPAKYRNARSTVQIQRTKQISTVPELLHCSGERNGTFPNILVNTNQAVRRYFNPSRQRRKLYFYNETNEHDDWVDAELLALMACDPPGYEDGDFEFLRPIRRMNPIRPQPAYRPTRFMQAYRAQKLRLRCSFMSKRQNS